MTNPGSARVRRCLAAAVFLAAVLPAAAQQPSSVSDGLTVPPPDLNRAPLIPRQMLLVATPEAPVSSPSRVRVFRIQPGFLSDVPWLGDDEPAAADKLAEPEPEPDFLTINYGNDNPNFDFRTPGDPGGVGFARVNSQLQLLDTSKTAISVGLQAVTPLGLAFDGLPDNRGTTVVTPGVSLFHELNQGFALQAFVSKNMPLENKNAQVIRCDVQYGLALNRAVTTNPTDPLSNLYLSVGALGAARPDSDGGRTLNWDLMPGLYYRLADNWWVSSGVLLPVGPTRYENGGLWRLTCRWQF